MASSPGSWFPYFAAGLALYPVVSWYFLRHPLKRTVHPPLAAPLQKITCSAHRGGAAERPENTMTAFAHAVAQGTELLELDVHLTRDGQVVVYHDATVDRLAEGGITGATDSFTYAELPRIRRSHIPLPPPFHLPGATLDWHLPAGASSAEVDAALRPPLLSEVFARFPNTCMNIDLKNGPPELVEAVHRLIETQPGRGERVIWGSSADRVAKLIAARTKQSGRDWATFASAKQVGLLYLKYITGVLPFCRVDARAIEVPLFTERGRAVLRAHGVGVNAKGEASWVSRVALALFARVSTSPPLLRHLRARNIKLVLWVLQDEDEFARALDDIGADIVMTDYPTKLADFVRKRREQQEGAGGAEADADGDGAASMASGDRKRR